MEEITNEKCSSKEKQEFLKKSQDTNNAVDETLLRKKLENFQSKIVSEVQKKIDILIDDIINEVNFDDIHAIQFKEVLLEKQKAIWANRQHDEKSKKANRFPDKVFTPRDSYFTCLYKVPHIKAVYHIFIIMLIIMVTNTAIHDYVIDGKLNIGQHTIKTGFGNLYYGFGIWFGMQTAVIGVYYAMKFWADVRVTLRKNESLQQLWDIICIIIFVSYQLVFAYATTYAVLKLNLALISSVSVLLEMIRFMMKAHAFVRSNAPNVIAPKEKTDDQTKSQNTPNYPPFSKFIYFLFAPTFIYRDEYPRTKRIRWGFALYHLLEVIGVMFFMANIHERYIRMNFENFGKEEIHKRDLVAKIFGMMMPGLLIFLSGFYCILHAWLNFTSELLTFSDRMFYKDWWAASNYGTYYRTWNVVVHDWLYEYIYKDMYNHILKRSKLCATLTVFLVSAIAHEYVLAFSFRFFYPVMFVFFAIIGVGVIFMTKGLNKTLGNIILWFTLPIGNGLMVSLYGMEYYTRQNCVEGDTLLDKCIPLSWTCNGLQ